MTFLVGENGSGKSTLVEAIAAAAGNNPEGGSRNAMHSSRVSESPSGRRSSWYAVPGSDARPTSCGRRPCTAT